MNGAIPSKKLAAVRVNLILLSLCITLCRQPKFVGMLSTPRAVRRKMNKQDKRLVDDFLARTDKKTKSKKRVVRRPRLTKAERQELNKAYMREMIIDTIALGISVLLIVAAIAWIVGKLNGQNC